ncbi:hypothetical protein Tco_0869049 [Tanacetum coccineum]
MVKFIFHLLDLSSGTVLLYQKLLEFNPVNLAPTTLCSYIFLLQELLFLGVSYWYLPLLPIVLPEAFGKVFSMLAACASRAAKTLSATGFLMAALVMAGASDVDVLLGCILST